MFDRGKPGLEYCFAPKIVASELRWYRNRALFVDYWSESLALTWGFSNQRHRHRNCSEQRKYLLNGWVHRYSMV